MIAVILCTSSPCEDDEKEEWVDSVSRQEEKEEAEEEEVEGEEEVEEEEAEEEEGEEEKDIEQENESQAEEKNLSEEEGDWQSKGADLSGSDTEEDNGPYSDSQDNIVSQPRGSGVPLASVLSWKLGTCPSASCNSAHCVGLSIVQQAAPPTHSFNSRAHFTR